MATMDAEKSNIRRCIQKHLLPDISNICADYAYDISFSSTHIRFEDRLSCITAIAGGFVCWCVYQYQKNHHLGNFQCKTKKIN
jgi:hypothetical protein